MKYSLQNWIFGKSSKFDVPVSKTCFPSSQDPSVSRLRTAAIIPKDQIRLGDKIGEGAHGSVHQGVWVDIHGSVSTLYTLGSYVMA